MNTYTFDIPVRFTVAVSAKSEAEARATIRDLHGSTVVLGKDTAGLTIATDLFVPRASDLDLIDKIEPTSTPPSGTYAETFRIPNTGTIKIDDDNTVWLNDRVIFQDSKSRAHARDVAYQYVKSHLRAFIAGHRERAMHGELALDKLGKTTDGLGKFVANGAASK